MIWTVGEINKTSKIESESLKMPKSVTTYYHHKLPTRWWVDIVILIFAVLLSGHEKLPPDKSVVGGEVVRFHLRFGY